MREICLDTETTGLSPHAGHKVIEIACVEMINRVKTGNVFHAYINPLRDVPAEAFKIHGISTEFLQDKPIFKDIAQDFLSFIKDSTLIIHNADFDIKFLNFELENCGLEKINKNNVIDSLLLARSKFPGAQNSLDALCKRFSIDLSKRIKHGALLDTELLLDVYIELTGGAQTGLEFGNGNIEKKAINKSENADYSNNRKIIESRNFSVSNQDLEKHKKFILNHFKTNDWGY